MKNRLAFLVALLLIGANLRAALTGVGPVLETIRADLMLSATAAGLLVSVPVLMFAAFAPLARLADRVGAERMILAGLLMLVVGLVGRVLGGAGVLFAGTVVLAIGIACTNVLLPVVIKHHYPDRVPSMTTAYATVMGAMAALASGVSVPLSQVLPGGWRSALAAWAVLAAVALVAWIPHSRPPPAAKPPVSAVHKQEVQRPAWRTSVAWQITGFMGLQSTVFYIVVNWFPVILGDAGFSPAAGGWLMTLYQVAALLAGLAVPLLIRSFRDQRGIAFGMSMLTMTGILGVLVAPEASVLWMIIMGCGSGPSLILALSFMGLRARTQESAAALSLVSQGVGYLVASFGPVVFGLVHDHTEGWTVAMLGTALVALAYGMCGVGAGRNVKV